MKLKEFQDKRFDNYAYQWQMRRLVEQPKKANASMVEEFYNKAPKQLKAPFTFRGVLVDISIDSISHYYGLMNVDKDGDKGMRAAELDPAKIQSLRRFLNVANEGEDVLASELNIHTALYLTWLKDNVIPRCKGSWFTLVR